MTRQISSPGYTALEPALERVFTRHAALVDAAAPNDDLIPDHQRNRIRRLMIALFRAAADRRASHYSSYSELPGHPDGPVLGRATLDRKRFVRILVSNAEQGFSVLWKWADEDFEFVELSGGENLIDERHVELVEKAALERKFEVYGFGCQSGTLGGR